MIKFKQHKSYIKRNYHYGRLRHLGIELTNRCDLRCQICNIWRERKKRDLSLEVIENICRLFKKPFFVALTGGEPILNREVNKIYRYFYNLYLNKKITGINISSNAYSTKIIDFLKENGESLQPLSLNVSIDGMEEHHNVQRGKKDAFEKTINNLIKIKTFPIPLTIKFIITSLNYTDLFNVYLLAKKLNCELKVNLCEKMNNYYHRAYKINNGLLLTGKQKENVQRTLERIIQLEKCNLNSKFIRFSLMHLQWLLNSKNLNFIKNYFNFHSISSSLFVTTDNKIYNCMYCAPIGKVFSKKIEIDFDKIFRIKQRALKMETPAYISPYSYLNQI